MPTSTLVMALILYTNIARQQLAMPPLQESKILDAMAYGRAATLFRTHEFNHNAFYDFDVYWGPYIALGENLAEGFNNDPRAIVNAFLASPTHRENMESIVFEEIGAANVGNITAVEYGRRR